MIDYLKILYPKTEFYEKLITKFPIIVDTGFLIVRVSIWSSYVKLSDWILSKKKDIIILVGKRKIKLYWLEKKDWYNWKCDKDLLPDHLAKWW